MVTYNLLSALSGVLPVLDIPYTLVATLDNSIVLCLNYKSFVVRKLVCTYRGDRYFYYGGKRFYLKSILYRQLLLYEVGAGNLD